MKKYFCTYPTLQWLGCFLLLGALGCAQHSDSSSSSNPNSNHAAEATFSNAGDWSGPNSTFSGTQTSSNGYLTLQDSASVFATPQIWVADSGENKVTKIDTTTYQNLGTFSLKDPNNPAAEDCYNPSRTAVDLDGSVWIGCRGKNAYLSANDLTPSMVPTMVDHKVVKLDPNGKFIFALNVGHAPRGLALDVNNRMWIANSVDDSVWVVDATTGACLLGNAPTLPNGPPCGGAPITLPYGSFPYGGVIDQRGHLWIPNRHLGNATNAGTLTEIDTSTNRIIGTYGPYMRSGNCGQIYGISIDPGNNIWLGGFSCNDVLKIKGGTGIDPISGLMFNSGAMIAAYQVGGMVSRGVSTDLNGDVWVASSSSNTASKLSNPTGKILATVNVGMGPIGIGVDAYGNAWVVNQLSNSVTRIDTLNTQNTNTIAVGSAPYTYSDMLGTLLRTITYGGDGFANWQTIIDSGVANPTWGNINWQVSTPDDTYITVSARCASTVVGLQTTAWGPAMTSPGPLQCGSGNSGEFANIQIRFYTNGNAAPVVKNLTVQWTK